MNGCAMIVLLVLAAPLGEAARIFGFKPLSMNSDSQIKAAPASSYPSVDLERNEHLSRSVSFEQHPGSEAKVEPNVSAKSKALHQRSHELLQRTLPSLKVDLVEPEMEKSVAPIEPLGHSPGIGHDNPPELLGHSPGIGHDNPPELLGHSPGIGHDNPPQLLGHSPGIGHDNPPQLLGHSPGIGHDNPPQLLGHSPGIGHDNPPQLLGHNVMPSFVCKAIRFH